MPIVLVTHDYLRGSWIAKRHFFRNHTVLHKQIHTKEPQPYSLYHFIVYSMLGISIKYEYPSLTMSHSLYGPKLVGFPDTRKLTAAIEKVCSDWSSLDRSDVYQVVLLSRFMGVIPVIVTW